MHWVWQRKHCSLGDDGDIDPQRDAFTRCLTVSSSSKIEACVCAHVRVSQSHAKIFFTPNSPQLYIVKSVLTSFWVMQSFSPSQSILHLKNGISKWNRICNKIKCWMEWFYQVLIGPWIMGGQDEKVSICDATQKRKSLEAEQINNTYNYKKRRLLKIIWINELCKKKEIKSNPIIIII